MFFFLCFFNKELTKLPAICFETTPAPTTSTTLTPTRKVVESKSIKKFFSIQDQLNLTRYLYMFLCFSFHSQSKWKLLDSVHAAGRGALRVHQQERHRLLVSDNAQLQLGKEESLLQQR